MSHPSRDLESSITSYQLPITRPHTAYVLIGAQGSGKSTWACANAERLGAVVVASDDIRNELEARGLYRERACSSLYIYCVYELRMSEDEAQRRCRAARLARQFPVLLVMLAESAIHLTGILLLGPHLTAENHGKLLARARHRTKRELERLVATI